MPKVITTSITLTHLLESSIVLYRGNDGVLKADCCYSTVKDDGTVYEVMAEPAVLPDGLAAALEAFWKECFAERAKALDVISVLSLADAQPAIAVEP